jgi:hypothetical protein
MQKEIHTPIPAGLFIKRPVSKKNNASDNELAFIITILEAKSIPHSVLFK